MHPVVQGEDILGEGLSREGEGAHVQLRGVSPPHGSRKARARARSGRWEDRLGLGMVGRLRGPHCTGWGLLLTGTRAPALDLAPTTSIPDWTQPNGALCCLPPLPRYPA